MSLAVPPPNRHRASSTNVRPALTINTLGRRRSLSLALPIQQSSEPSTPTAAHPAAASISTSSLSQPSQPSMLGLLVSKCLELLHVPTQHSINWSTPSSPYSSSDDDLVLPLSASSQKATFGDVSNEKQTSKSHRLCLRTPTVHEPLLLVVLLFPLSTALVFLSLYSLPISVTWPRTLSELAELNLELQRYSQSGPGPLAHVIGVLSVTAVWKHAWSIPGSVIWNVLAGALFHPLWATLLLSALTTMGSVFATLLCMPLAPSLSRLWPRALEMTRNAIEGEPDLSTSSKLKSPAWVRLSILRLVGIVPWSGINIACGVCGVALSDCTLGSFIGCLPWTAVTCQIGDILQTVASAASPAHETVSSLLASPDIVLKLVVLSFLSLAPILGRERLRALVLKSPSVQSDIAKVDKRNWLLRWPTTIRLPSRARSRTEDRRPDQTAPPKSAFP
ncbi:snare associated Golgi protein-domain-containing protein [Pisolithus orientalis]|uniref:snare associated Golgi protein-domain-containing protein n=1 Tax=Pisolithus orientalis TaxID=936130 RepID=UPI0022242FB4|nr:snare associated Golgi protein-domain-containing protein [Pisolithus orientalis]KAI6035176.1 snare associated Golgi protein-domain-containing protein [Pisolithus orientalis]